MKSFVIFLLVPYLWFCGMVAFAEPTVVEKEPPKHLITRWAADALAGAEHPEYPRPDMVRSNWMSLNGKWDYTLVSFTGPSLIRRTGVILVPFPVESFLSGVQTAFNPFEQLEYHRSFTVPEAWHGQRILLHFDAVNWEARVELNGKLLGIHQGGYDRFTFDITDALISKGDQQLTVVVKNPMDHGVQPRGKQNSSPHGIWYTSATGIWQTVWLEPVPASSIESVQLRPDVDKGELNILVQSRGNAKDLKITATAFDNSNEIARVTGPVGTFFSLPVNHAKLWSPEHPKLYDLKLSLIAGNGTVDSVISYFGMRKISVAKGADGLPRIRLNNEPYFQLGVLDQGYWPDGIYTAPTDEALKSDIQLTRDLGFNLCRKHVKIEPERWYYWCDKLGLLVWQDMPSAGGFVAPRNSDVQFQGVARQQFSNELAQAVEQHINHPSIVMWIAFNEGWGQHDTLQTISNIRKMDPSRLVIGASGWNDRGGGDVLSLHSYPGPATPRFTDDRAVVCGECGGLGLAVPDHLWRRPSLAWSYSRFQIGAELQEAYNELFDRIVAKRKAGLSGVVITQLSDVETEVNGLVTYDRAVVKINPTILRQKLENIR